MTQTCRTHATRIPMTCIIGCIFYLKAALVLQPMLLCSAQRLTEILQQSLPRMRSDRSSFSVARLQRWVAAVATTPLCLQTLVLSMGRKQSTYQTVYQSCSRPVLAGSYVTMLCSTVLTGLLHPSATIMDVNIGAALWTAAQAEGKLTIVKGSTASSFPTNSFKSHHPVTACQKQQQQEEAVAQQKSGRTSLTPDCASDRQQAAPFEQSIESQEQVGGPNLSQQPQGSTVGIPDSKLQYAKPAEKHQASTQQEAVSTEQQEGPAQHEQRQVAQHEQTRTAQHDWYRSAARVVLLGHGADEQHAGYGRHRTSFRNQVCTGSL